MRDDLGPVQAALLWVVLSLKRAYKMIESNGSKTYRRCRRRMLTFKRITLGSRSLFLFKFKGLDEIMMSLEKDYEHDAKDVNAEAIHTMKQQIGLEKENRGHQHHDDEDATTMERLKARMMSCGKSMKKCFDPKSWFKKREMDDMDLTEADDFDLGSSASSDHRSPFAAGDLSTRERARRLMKHPKFDQIILICIAASSILMVVNTPLSDPRESIQEFYFAMDWVFGIIFTIEMVTKMIAMGVLVNNNPSPEQFAELQEELEQQEVEEKAFQKEQERQREDEEAEEQRRRDQLKTWEEERERARASMNSGSAKTLSMARGENIKRRDSSEDQDDTEEGVEEIERMIAAERAAAAVRASMKSGGSLLAVFGNQENEEPEVVDIDDDVEKHSGSTSSSLCAVLYQTPYLGDPWNILDFIVVCVAWIELLQVVDGGSFLKVLRLFRTLRPLRMISRNPNLKLVVTTLFKSFPQLVTLCVFGGFILLLFGVFATSYLKGALNECKDSSGSPMEFYNSTCRDSYCNDLRNGYCMDRDNYNFVTYARYPEIDPEDPYIQLRHTTLPTTAAAAAAAAGSATDERTLVDFRTDASYWSSNRMCYEQLRYTFFEPASEITAAHVNVTYAGAANPPALSSLAKTNLLYQPSRSNSKAYVPDTYNESFWQMQYPDAATRENKIWEEIQRRYAPVARASPDTPMCVLNCAAEPASNHAFCAESKIVPAHEAPTIEGAEHGFVFDKNIWGHRVMQCTDCFSAFCTESDAVQTYDECKYQCEGPESYNVYCTSDACKSEGTDSISQGCATCRAQCIAQCRCPDVCQPHIEAATSCILAEGRWAPVVKGMGFDNILEAAFTLFQVITTEGWVVVMLAVVDQDGIFQDPIRDNTELWVVFFWVYSLVGYFFLANVVIGVIIDNFNQMKREAEEGTNEQKVLSEAQHRWYQCQKIFYATRSFFLITNVETLPPGQRWLFFTVSSKRFERFIMAVIILNIVAMTFTMHPEPTDEDSLAYDLFQNIQPINFFSLIVFNIEFLLKFAAFGLSYFQDWWNRFDFGCVLSSNVGYVLEQFDVGDTGSLSIIRMFR
ncbi:unnamed protein product, partial [Amoebophrya sp. A25]|eukprot:GSA25T00012017001.1